jgi:hypothetical protein
MDGDVRAFGSEGLDDRRSGSPTPTGHEDDLAGQSEVHR